MSKKKMGEKARSAKRCRQKRRKQRKQRRAAAKPDTPDQHDEYKTMWLDGAAESIVQNQGSDHNYASDSTWGGVSDDGGDGPERNLDDGFDTDMHDFQLSGPVAIPGTLDVVLENQGEADVDSQVSTEDGSQDVDMTDNQVPSLVDTPLFETRMAQYLSQHQSDDDLYTQPGTQEEVVTDSSDIEMVNNPAPQPVVVTASVKDHDMQDVGGVHNDIDVEPAEVDNEADLKFEHAYGKDRYLTIPTPTYHGWSLLFALQQALSIMYRERAPELFGLCMAYLRFIRARDIQHGLAMATFHADEAGYFVHEWVRDNLDGEKIQLGVLYISSRSSHGRRPRAKLYNFTDSVTVHADRILWLQHIKSEIHFEPVLPSSFICDDGVTSQLVAMSKMNRQEEVARILTLERKLAVRGRDIVDIDEEVAQILLDMAEVDDVLERSLDRAYGIPQVPADYHSSEWYSDDSDQLSEDWDAEEE